MLFKEYVRLGKISLKNRKKSTRNTVCGVAFGLSLLVAVLFFTLAFSLDLTGAIDSARNVTCFAIPMSNELDSRDGYGEIDEEEEFDGSYEGVLFGDTERKALFAQLGNAVEEIVSHELVFVGAWNDEYFLNGEPLTTEWLSDGYGYQYGTKIKIVRGENADCIPAGIRGDLARLNQTFLAAGRGFSQSSKGEIMISETLVRANGMMPEEAIGGLLSLKTAVRNRGSNHIGFDLDNDNDPDNAYVEPYEPIIKNATLFENYRVVGVISKAYYQLNNILEADAHIWITGDSYYGDAQTTVPKYMPVLRCHTDEKGWVTRVATYTEGFGAMQRAALQDGMFFAAHPGVSFAYGNAEYNAVVYFVQCKDFDSSLQLIELCRRGYKRLGWNFDEYEIIKNFTCSSYKDFLALYRVGNYLMLFLYVFGGTIFLGTMLNLYNSVHYSVQVRRRYLGMMRAIGAKKSVLPRLYFTEILLIFARGLPWAVCCGGALSFGIKLGVDAAFSNAETIFSVAIRLRFGFFFAALGIALAVMLLVAFVFSRIAARRIAGAAIADVLSAEG